MAGDNNGSLSGLRSGKKRSSGPKKEFRRAPKHCPRCEEEMEPGRKRAKIARDKRAAQAEEATMGGFAYKKNWVPSNLWSENEGMTMCLLADKGWGKTGMILALMEPFLDRWDMVWVITRNRDGELLPLVKDKRCILPRITNDFVNEIIDMQKEKDERERKFWAVVFDDCIGDEKELRYLQSLDELALTNSHSKIDVFFACQKATKIPHSIRQNAQAWFLGGITKQTAKDVAAFVLNPGDDVKLFEKKLNLVGRKQDHMFYYTRRLVPREEVIMKAPNAKPDRHTSKNKGPEQGQYDQDHNDKIAHLLSSIEEQPK